MKFNYKIKNLRIIQLHVCLSLLLTKKKTKKALLIIFLQIIHLKYQMFNKIIAMKAKIHQLIMNWMQKLLKFLRKLNSKLNSVIMLYTWTQQIKPKWISVIFWIQQNLFKCMLSQQEVDIWILRVAIMKLIST